MARPLFTKDECDRYDREIQALRDAQPRMKFSELWNQIDAFERALQLRTVARVHDRAEELLNALLIIIGSRGHLYVDFYHAFASSDTSDYRRQVKEFNTTEARRDLYTLLRALTEIPKTWARSAFVRFLRGTGKQAGAKYHGAGRFSTTYGWPGIYVTAIAKILTDDGPYAKVLMSYADAAEEIQAANPDFEVTDIDASFKAVRVERDVEFLNRLCAILEVQGLAPIPTPQEKVPKQKRAPRVYKPGDIIRLRTLRDLPLPAHVRVSIEKRMARTEEWVFDTVDWVITDVRPGFCHCYRLDSGGQTAYLADNVGSTAERKWLEGAMYVGPWTGTINKQKQLGYKFDYRRATRATTKK